MAGIIGADNRFGRDFNNPGPDKQATSPRYTTPVA